MQHGVVEFCRFSLEGLVDDVQLVLDPLSALRSEVDYLKCLFLGVFSIGIE